MAGRHKVVFATTRLLLFSGHPHAAPMRSLDMRGFDFTPALFVTLTLFVTIGAFQFLQGLPGGERGLLAFEKACPIYGKHASFAVQDDENRAQHVIRIGQHRPLK